MLSCKLNLPSFRGDLVGVSPAVPLFLFLGMAMLSQEGGTSRFRFWELMGVVGGLGGVRGEAGAGESTV